MSDLTKEQAKDKVKAISESLSSYFDKEEVEIGVAMSVLLTMCVHTMLRQAHIPPQDAIKIFAEAVCFHVNSEKDDDGDEDNEGEVQWLN